MANTTYKHSIRPQFQGVPAQDVSYDLSQPKEMLGELAQGLEQEAKTLQDIAQDESQIAFNQGAAALVDKYGTDYKGLNGALLKLEQENYNKFGKDNPRLANDLLRQQDAVRLRAVKAARNKYVNENNRKIKEGSGRLLEGFKIAMPDDYANYLDTIRKPAEQQDTDLIGQWENNLQQIDTLLNRRDMDGNYIFDSKTRKYKPFIQGYMVDGGKTLIDRFFANNDEEGLKQYYESQILAPARYMEQTGMDRDTYDKVRAYAEKNLKQMGVETNKMKFNQSVADAMALQVEFSDEKINNLEESGILPKKVVKQLRENNVKFSQIDPAKAEVPTALIDTLQIVNDFSLDYADDRDAKLKTIDEGLTAMEQLADYAQKNGLSPDNIKRGQEMIVRKEQDALFGDIYRKFGGIIDNFQTKRSRVRRGPTSFGALTNWDGMPNHERNQITQLEIILGSAIDQIHGAVANNEPITPILEKTYESAAKLYYQDDISAADWAKVQADPDAIIMFRGDPVKVKGFTDDGDIIFERQ